MTNTEIAVRIEKRGPIRVACLEVVGRRSELSHRAPMAWLELTRRAAEREGSGPATYYALVREEDHALGVDDPTYLYRVGFELDPAEQPPAGLSVLTVPARRYAAATVRGDAERIEATYRGLTEWIKQRGLAVEQDGLGLEIYELSRQPPTPPYERFDYDVLRPLIG